MSEHIELVGALVVLLGLWCIRLVTSRFTRLETRVDALEVMHSKEFKGLGEKLDAIETNLVDRIGAVHLELKGEYVRKGECAKFLGDKEP
jgi:hypothetical protein